jgi:hypothetical protein
MSDRHKHDDASTTTTTTTTNRRKCDSQLIKYVKETILLIEKSQLQCNVLSINAHLKANYAHLYPKILKLTENQLMYELDLAVKDGIMWRRFGNTAKRSGDHHTDHTDHSSSSLSTHQPKKVVRLPRLESASQTKNEKEETNTMIQLVMKSMASINKQYFNQKQTSTTTNSEDNGNMCTLDELCKYMLDVYKFEANSDDTGGVFDLTANVKQTLFKLLCKNKKIFIKELIKCDENEDGGDSSEAIYSFKYKLNADYIKQKLEQNLFYAKKVFDNEKEVTETNEPKVEINNVKEKSIMQSPHEPPKKVNSVVVEEPEKEKSDLSIEDAQFIKKLSTANIIPTYNSSHGQSLQNSASTVFQPELTEAGKRPYSSQSSLDTIRFGLNDFLEVDSRPAAKKPRSEMQISEGFQKSESGLSTTINNNRHNLEVLETLRTPNLKV